MASSLPTAAPARTLHSYVPDIALVAAGYAVVALALVDSVPGTPRLVRQDGSVDGAALHAASAVRLALAFGTACLFFVAAGPVLVWPAIIARQYRLGRRSRPVWGEWVLTAAFPLLLWLLAQAFDWVAAGWPLESALLGWPLDAWCFLALGLVSVAGFAVRSRDRRARPWADRLGLWAGVMLASRCLIRVGGA